MVTNPLCFGMPFGGHFHCLPNYEHVFVQSWRYYILDCLGYYQPCHQPSKFLVAIKLAINLWNKNTMKVFDYHLHHLWHCCWTVCTVLQHFAMLPWNHRLLLHGMLLLVILANAKTALQQAIGCPQINQLDFEALGLVRPMGVLVHGLCSCTGIWCGYYVLHHKVCWRSWSCGPLYLLLWSISMRRQHVFFLLLDLAFFIWAVG